MRKWFLYEDKIGNDGFREILIKIFGIKISKKFRTQLKQYFDNYVKKPYVNLSLVSIAKNEGPYIKEWIEFHKLVGVDRFYFYDNESTDNTREILEPYIKDGSVVYTYVKGRCLQNFVYADAVYKYKNQTKWMGVIDLDEYIVPVEKNNIVDFLKDYENYPAVGINWLMFDCNGHKTKPVAEGGLITANYTRAMLKSDKTNTHIKSIFNPREVKKIYNPHYAIYSKCRSAVTENFEKIKDANTKYHSSEKIQINHYFCKSVEEYDKKIARGYADMNKDRDYINEYVNFPEFTYDYAIQKYVPELKKRMGIKEIKQ